MSAAATGSETVPAPTRPAAPAATRSQRRLKRCAATPSPVASDAVNLRWVDNPRFRCAFRAAFAGTTIDLLIHTSVERWVVVNLAGTASLRAARDTFDAIGLTPWGERARQALRASGETSRRRP